MPTHPLTARVAVNRFWHQYFGAGLVKTCEDFGLQGELPSNPELLDWLASRVRAKRLGREGAAAADRHERDLPPGRDGTTPELLERDPENRLLARGPRFRLSAEMIRDNALAVGGLLGQQGRRAEREAVPAGGAVGRRRRRRELYRHGLQARHTAKTCTAGACTRSGSAPPRRRR